MKRRVPGPADRAYQVFSSSAPPPPPYPAYPSYSYGQQQQQQQQQSPPPPPPAPAAATTVHHRNVGAHSSSYNGSQQYFAHQQQQHPQQQQPTFTPPAASSLYLQQGNTINTIKYNYSNYAIPVNGGAEGNENKSRGQVNKQKKLTAVSRTVLAFRRILIAVCFIVVGLQLGRFVVQQQKGGLLQTTSNFILFDTFDLSPVIALYYYYFGAQTCRPDMYYWNGIQPFAAHDDEGEDNVMFDCTFNLCSPIAQGNEGSMYNGACYLKSPHHAAADADTDMTAAIADAAAAAAAAVTRPVVLKTMKQRVGPWLQHEIAASQIIGKQHPTAALTHYAHGFNFILMSQLVNYHNLNNVHADEESVPPHQVKNFVNQQGIQIMDQLRYLHRNGYLHLDVWAPNIMYLAHAATAAAATADAGSEEEPTAPSWDFQLVDFTRARPMSQAKAVIQESMHNHFHLPKMPVVLCLLQNDDDDNNSNSNDDDNINHDIEQGQWKEAVKRRLGHWMDHHHHHHGDKMAMTMDDDKVSSYCADLKVTNAIHQHQVCPAFLDVYPLAIRMLRDLYTLGAPPSPNNDNNHESSSTSSNSHRPWPSQQLEKSRHPTFDDILQKHEEYMDILKIVETEHGQDDPTVQLIAQWTDMNRLNATLVCDEGGSGGNNNN